jgi:hypothetical protein
VVHHASFICAILVAIRTSEKSEYFNETTWLYIPESIHIQSLPLFLGSMG